MRDQYDFTKAERGKFYQSEATVKIPLYLDTDVQTALETLALAKGKDYSILVNDLLKKDIELIQLAQ